MKLHWFSIDEPSRSEALKTATDFPLDCGLAITTNEGIPGVDPGTEAVYSIILYIMKAPSNSADVGDMLVFIDLLKVPSKPDSKFSKNEEPLGTENKVLFLSQALDIAIEARSLPAALMIHGSAMRVQRGIGKTSKATNIAIAKMQQRAAAFAVEALHQPMSTFVTFAGEPKKESAFVKALAARLLNVDCYTKGYLVKLFESAIDVCDFFDNPSNSLQDRSAADLYSQVLTHVPSYRSCSALWHNAGLNAKNRMIDLMEANSTCEKVQCEAARWFKKAERYFFKLASILQQQKDPLELTRLFFLNDGIVKLFYSDVIPMIEKGAGAKILGTKQQRAVQVSRAQNILQQLMKVHFPDLCHPTSHELNSKFRPQPESRKAEQNLIFSKLGAVDVQKCHGCGKSGVELKRCGQCKNRLYCNPECQRADWKTHKHLCMGKKAGRERLVEQQRGRA
uniref:MYND-type domain-containing protein n=1 Tax=Chromera velia CCMP2878 TaxID=1169474 RepID=A0A0G4HD24_9ALVE|eukprot:Cvel_26352.t1-p1 / transcript=Cvel_26352.t1 / gene=Cvel_26352 / organism=Chromera_velia_CCMP2878 / gene_product=Ankyrin repeat and MYND domain-containing protein 2, putative / transcript_product=Ankyrin repeat and MYND domain-containing protein 2, putative / location=Cvel_scaffold3120:17942-19772(+) / protein_length=450 / sequence_SO=supercontig / SO=protein_coding / is_pseudo=false